MNALQLIRTAHLEVDAIRADGTIMLWTPEESLNALNIAMERAARILRLADSESLTRSLLSTGAVQEFVTEPYDPASLRLVSGTTDYTLPPDYVSIVSIMPITVGFDEVRFLPGKSSQRNFIDERTTPSADLMTAVNSPVNFHYTVIGERTLRIAPTPQDSIDLELVYRYRPARLLNYTAGTVDFTNLSTAVHGHGVTWVAAGLRTPAELVAGMTVTLDRHYQRIASFTSDVDLVLSRGWAEGSKNGLYTISMVPPLPEEHHNWLAQMTASMLLRKVNLDLSEKSKTALEAQLANEVQPEVTIRQTQESIPVEPYRIDG
jgi:hypothetical protein